MHVDASVLLEECLELFKQLDAIEATRIVSCWSVMRSNREEGPRLWKAKEGEGGKHAGLKGPRVEGAGGLEAKKLGRKRVRREESEPAM